MACLTSLAYIPAPERVSRNAEIHPAPSSCTIAYPQILLTEEPDQTGYFLLFLPTLNEPAQVTHSVGFQLPLIEMDHKNRTVVAKRILMEPFLQTQ